MSNMRCAAWMLMLAGSPAAFAQSTVAPTDMVDSGAQGEDIVVTGEKTHRPLQETITSVRVVTARDMERENLLSVYDVIARTANVSASARNSGFSIRGIANDNVTGVGTGDLATIYLDGSPIPREALAGPLDLWDLAQVEILRGPQSTLQGRNALAGSIILRTTDPTYYWSGKARVVVTDAIDERRFAAAIGGPLIADQVAFRLSGEHSRTDGATYNPTLDDHRVNRRDGDNIRAKLLVTPAALPGLRIVGTYFYDRHENGENYSFSDYPGSWDNRIILSNRRAAKHYHSNIGTVQAQYAMAPGLALTSITTLARIRTSSVYDGDNLAVDQAYGSLSKDQKTFTQETRLNINSGKLNALIGTYYSRFGNKQDRAASIFSLSPVDDLGLPPRVSAIYPAQLFVDTSQFYPQVIKTMALFGDATWEAAPRLKLRAGFRWDQEKQSRANNNRVILITPLPDPAAFAGVGLSNTVTAINSLINGYIAAANSVSPAAKTTFRAFLPKGGVTYDLSDAASISATVQRGYRSGGSGVNPGKGAIFTYKPEFTWNYEVALRSLWLDRKLSLNANGFYIDWTDQQILFHPSPYQTYNYLTINAGSSRVYGFELESRYQPVSAVSLYGSLGYTNTKFRKFVTDTADYSGNAFPNAPHWTFAAGGTWEAKQGWFVNLNANYHAAAYQMIDHSKGHELKAHLLANAKVGWQNAHFGTYLTATNIFDQHYWDFRIINGTREQAIYGTPRTLGMTLEAHF